jgi:hypothetical protein
MKPPFEITTTLGRQDAHITAVIHGPSGAGKTYLSRTTGQTESTLILSVANGLLSLRDVEIAAVELGGWEELRQMFGWLLQQKPQPYTWVIVDSISELAESLLNGLKEQSRDPRQAYGEMQDSVVRFVRAVRSLPCNVVLLAKQERLQDDQGRMLYAPSFPGKRLSQAIPYLVDEVLALIPNQDEETGQMKPYLQCHPDSSYTAKDRSGRLALHELANLAAVYRKINGGKTDVSS